MSTSSLHILCLYMEFDQALDKAIKYLGGRNKFCGIMDCSLSAVGQWKKRKYIPPERAKQIELLTNNTIKRSELNDVFN